MTEKNNCRLLYREEFQTSNLIIVTWLEIWMFVLRDDNARDTINLGTQFGGNNTRYASHIETNECEQNWIDHNIPCLERPINFIYAKK